MSQQIEAVLRKTLDDVDRTRRRQIAAGAIFLLAFLVQTVSVITTLHRSGATNDLRVTLIAGAELMAFAVGFCTLGICVFVSRMTRKILQAIELLSKE